MVEKSLETFKQVTEPDSFKMMNQPVSNSPKKPSSPNGGTNKQIDKAWIRRLWIDFERDDDFDEHAEYDDDDVDGGMVLLDVAELRLDNHTASIAHLTELRDYVWFERSRVPLTKLEIQKVLFTQEKTDLITDVLKSQNCQIRELVLDSCRAKSDKMGQVFLALAQNKSILSLTMENMNIPLSSLDQFVDVLKKNETMYILTLQNTGLTDDAMRKLAEGLHSNRTLVYMDLRRNTYENEGLQALLHSLMGNDSLMTLRLNTLQITPKGAKNFQQLFSDSLCQIQNLEMEELEVAEDGACTVIDAIKGLRKLYTFDFSNNVIPANLAESIVAMVDKYTMLEILCLDHCEISEKIFRDMFQRINNRELIFLNISWNQLSGDTIDEVVRVLSNNPNLKKLAMQHNRFGEVDLTEFANVLAAHRELEYLDITSNWIGNTQFNVLYPAVQSKQTKLKTFNCRKNRIGGDKIVDTLEIRSKHLEIIDLSANKLTEANAEQLLQYAHEEVTLYGVHLQKNVMVNASLINEITQECRQNILIKRKILTTLPFSNQLEATSIFSQVQKRNSYADFDVSKLELADQRLLHFDFVIKFIKGNQDLCKQLSLKNLDLSKVQAQVSRGFEITVHDIRKLQVLEIENIDLDPKPIKRILRALKKMNQLKELRLVNIPIMELYMRELSEALTGCKSLKILDLRQERRTREIGPLVPLLAENRTIQYLDISGAIISKINMGHLWLALHKNISIHDLVYSRINFFAIMEIKAIDAELALNKIIQEEIQPTFEANQFSQSGKELSLKGYTVAKENSPAILKYIKMQTQMTSLDLSGTGLSRFDMNQFVIEIVKREVKLTSLNLGDNESISDEVVEDLSELFSQHSTLQELFLDKTKITSKGVNLILESICQSLKVRTISTRDCGLQLSFTRGKQILETLAKNISLVKFDYTDNYFDMYFQQGVEKELALNKQIVDKILPQLINQEVQARDNKKMKRRRTDINFSPALKNDKRAKTQYETLDMARKSFLNDPMNVKMMKTEGDDDDDPFQTKRLDEDDPALLEEVLDEDPPASSRFQKIGTQAVRPQKKATLMTKNMNRQATQKTKKKIKRIASSDEEDVEDSEGFNSGLQSSSDDQSYIDEPEEDQVGSFREINQGYAGFNLSLKGVKIDQGIEFITKFTHVFQKIKTIDFGDNKLDSGGAAALSKELQLNKYIQNVVVKKKGMGGHEANMLEKEIAKNKAIYDLSQQPDFDVNSKQFSLANKNLTDLSFLPKMMSDFTKLEVLDLSSSDLRSKDSVHQLCVMIDENSTIKELRLRDCKINAKTLTVLAGVLTKTQNQHLIHLDIRDNPIQDEQYKLLFGLLQNNHTIQNIEYTLYDEENIKKYNEFREFEKQELSAHDIAEALAHGGHGHHVHIPLWQKILLLPWLWKTLIHDKHEAFRFKYDTKALQRIELWLMPRIKRHLYWWSIAYYLVVLVIPYAAVPQECGKTYDPWLYYLFGVYITFSGVWEICQVLEIQRIANNKRLLQFNKWHTVELFMGSIARTDTFLDILFLHLIMRCWDDFEPWCISSLTFAILNILFPLVMLIRLLKTDFGNSLVQPYMESACFVSFIRETMLLATVLDSFCINNSFYVRGKPLVFGKLMGFISFFTQDFPQLTIHVLFKLVIISDAQKKLKTQTLLLVGMVCSGFAILISLFNMIMCAQNEFDPIILEKELLDRRQHAAKKQKRLDALEQSTKDKQDKNHRHNSMEDISNTFALEQPVMDKAKAHSLMKSGTQRFSAIDLDSDKKDIARPSLLNKLKKQFAEQKQATGGVGDQIDDYVKYYDNAKQSGLVSFKNDENNENACFGKDQNNHDGAAETQRQLLANANRLSCDSPKVVEQKLPRKQDTQPIVMNYGASIGSNGRTDAQDRETGASEIPPASPHPTRSTNVQNQLRESQRKIITEEQDASRQNDNRSSNSSGMKGLIRQQREEMNRQRSSPLRASVTKRSSPLRASVTRVQPSERLPQKNLSSMVSSQHQHHDGSFETNEDRDEKKMRIVSPTTGSDRIVMQGFNVEEKHASRLKSKFEGPDIMAGEQQFDEINAPLNVQDNSAIVSDQQLNQMVQSQVNQLNFRASSPTNANGSPRTFAQTGFNILQDGSAASSNNSLEDDAAKTINH